MLAERDIGMFYRRELDFEMEMKMNGLYFNYVVGTKFRSDSKRKWNCYNASKSDSYTSPIFKSIFDFGYKLNRLET